MAEPPAKSRATDGAGKGRAQESAAKSRAPEPSLDPVVAWQKFVSDWEKQINAISAKVTATEEFSRALNQAAKYSMIAQQQFDRQMEQFLKTLHLPSKSDITAIHDRLAAIEDSIERLAIAMDRGQQPTSAVTAPARTRRPPPEAE